MAVIDIHDQLRAAAIAATVDAETKMLFGFHPFRREPESPAMRMVRDAAYWGAPVGTPISRLKRKLKRATESEADRKKRFDMAWRALHSDDPELRMRWWRGEDI